MGSTKVVTPVAAADGDDAELGDDDRRADGGRNLLRGLDAETDVALGVTNDDNGLEPGALTGTGLLLDGLDLYALKKIPRSAIRSNSSIVPLEPRSLSNLGPSAPGHLLGHPHLHDLILELGKEVVDDLVLLDGERVEVDLLEAVDLAGLYETAELGDGLPLLLLLHSATATATATATTPATVSTGSESATGGGTTTVSHFDRRLEFGRGFGLSNSGCGGFRRSFVEVEVGGVVSRLVGRLVTFL